MTNPPTCSEAADRKEQSDDSLFYANARAHLLDELRWLNRLSAAHVLRLRRANFYDSVKDFRGFFIADDDIDALLAAEVFGENGQVDDQSQAETASQLLTQAQRLRYRINQRVENSLRQNIFLPFRHLRACFHLSEFEQQTLLIGLAPQIDARYEKLYAYLQNDISKKTPSRDLILSLLCPTVEARLQALAVFHLAAPLRHYRLLERVESNAGTSAAQYFFRADARIVHYILGHQYIDERLLPHLRFLPPLEWQQVVVPETLKSRLQKLVQNLLYHSEEPRAALYLYGRSGVGKKTITRALCHEAGLKLAVADLRSLLQAPENFAENIRLVLREGRLQPCAVYFDHLEILESAESERILLFSTFIKEMQGSTGVTFFGSEKPLPAELFETLPIYALEIPAPNHAGQNAIWKIHLNGALAKSDQLLEKLTAQFNLTGGQIANAVRLAKQDAWPRDSANGHLTITDLTAASRLQMQPRLAPLAQKITPVYVWDDLVLPDDTLAQLQEICRRVKHHHRVLGEWGFGRKLSHGKGINVLFAGPSGTGKTMAAEIIANELQLDLYKIDLAGVVSKYIGETEKNLDRIFTAAEHANFILFFDEADALFGKRSEVRDAHDRYANIEISYLLQKMEQYEGLTILASNLRQNLDESFTRRLAFTIHFSLPDETGRRKIWQGIWPQEMPLAREVDLDALARQFKLSGGNIKNIALAAAFLAAEDGGVVSTAHLLQATKREYQKMGKVLSEAELLSFK